MSLKLIYIEIHFLSFFILLCMFMHVLSCAEQQGLIFNGLPLYSYPIDEPSEITLIYFGFFFFLNLFGSKNQQGQNDLLFKCLFVFSKYENYKCII